MSEHHAQAERSEVTSRRRQAGCLGCLLILVAGFGFVLFVIWSEPPGFEHRLEIWTFWRLRVGMTQQQVEEVFGLPPGDYSSRPDQDRPPDIGKRRPDLRCEQWVGDGFGAAIYFDRDDKVADFELWLTNPPAKTWKDRLKSWFYAAKDRIEARHQP
jgi:hypothetical protein